MGLEKKLNIKTTKNNFLEDKLFTLEEENKILTKNEQIANQKYEKMTEVVKSNHIKLSTTIKRKDEIISNYEIEFQKCKDGILKLKKKSNEKEKELQNSLIQKEEKIKE